MIWLQLSGCKKPCKQGTITKPPFCNWTLLYHFNQVFSHASWPKKPTVLKFTLIQKRIYQTSRRPKFSKSWTLGHNGRVLDFSCPFLILSSLRNYRDLGEMSLCICLHFYLKIFCSLFIVIACRKFWTDLFAICGNAPSRRIQSPTVSTLPKTISSIRMSVGW